MNVHLPGKKREWSREGGETMHIGTKFPLLPLHSVIWEMLHLLVAIVPHGNRADNPCLINAWHGRVHAAKSVSGSAVFIVNLGSHSLVSER